MRKLLVGVVMLLLIVMGCSNSGDSITCKLQDNTTEVTIEIIEASGKIGKIIFTTKEEDDSYTKLKASDIVELQRYTESLHSAYDGVDAKVDVEDNVLIVIMTIDIQKVDSLPDQLNMLGSSTNILKNMSFDDAVERMKAMEELTCE